MAKNEDTGISTLQEKPQTSKIDESELHWFWRITSKPYFFILYYIILAFIIAVISNVTDDSIFNSLPLVFIIIVLFMPNGLIYLVLHFFEDGPTKVLWEFNKEAMYYAIIFWIIF